MTPPKIIYQFVLLRGTTEHPLTLQVDAWVACGNGKKFPGIAIIEAPLSDNPCLSVQKPFGIKGIKQIIDAIESGINTSDIVEPE